jgi:hypothetical protein
MLAYKKKTIRARLRLMRLVRRKTPEGKTSLLPQCRTGQWIGASLYLMNVFLTGTKLGKKLLYRVPPKLIRVYNQFVTRRLVGGFEPRSKQTATEGVDPW